MSVDTFEPSLPTLDKLGVSLQADLDVQKVAEEWFRAFSQHVSATNIDGLLDLFVEDAWWRDMLALTWEFRTFHGVHKIRKLLNDRLPRAKLSAFKLGSVLLDQEYADLAWIQVLFDFETDVGVADGVVRLIPQSSGIWKAHNIYTNLDGLKAFPEKTGIRRDHLPNHGKWKNQRAQEREFADADPTVLVIGGGQSGLDIAARLKHLDVPTLVIEKQERIGDQWRHRYEALCLHDPVWYDHMPYLPFPSTWPVYTPAQKLADWLEFYAEAMELNVWTASTVLHADQLEDKTWTVTVQRADGTERKLHVQHLVLALGLGAGNPKYPNIPGQDEFQGQTLHSMYHKSAKDHIGKKVVVVGASTSAHDIAGDYHEHGVDVTIIQREPTYVMSTKNGMPKVVGRLYWEGKNPVEIADRLNASIPTDLMKLIWQRITADIAEDDKELLNGLRNVGFKIYQGLEDTGFLYLAMTRGGGYYLNVGVSDLIVDGKVKLKSDSAIERFTKTGLQFEDGSELDADVVLFATGFDSPHGTIEKLCGKEVASQVGPIWGLDEEGELRHAWRWLGVPNLWFMMGNLAWCRFHSRHMALQIKAQLEGQFGPRYTE